MMPNKFPRYIFAKHDHPVFRLPKVAPIQNYKKSLWDPNVGQKGIGEKEKVVLSEIGSGHIYKPFPTPLKWEN